MVKIDEEEQRYDRQIRLWGAEAQKNLRQANILLIGVTGLGSEIVKNVVLSGINSMTLCDDRSLKEMEMGEVESQMLIPFEVKEKYLADEAAASGEQAEGSPKTVAELSIPRCNELNPNVKTTAERKIPYEEIRAKNYDIVVCCDKLRKVELECYEACCSSNTPFLCGKTAGFFGQAVIDCGRGYTCQVSQTQIKNANLESKNKKDENEEEGEKFVEEKFDYKKFNEIVEMLNSDSTPVFGKLRKRELKNLNQAAIIMQILYHQKQPTSDSAHQTSLQLTGNENFWTGANANFHNLEQIEFSSNGQLSAVCAVVGGFMAQEVIRVASKKEKPFEYIFYFDGLNYKGDVMVL